MDHYSYDSGSLADIANKLRDGTNGLGAAARSAPPGPDAGDSSAIVGRALSSLVKAAATAAGVMELTAGKVHAAQGGYDTTEADNAADLRKQHVPR